jgi:DNA-binding NarL/FixJ family response regulator
MQSTTTNKDEGSHWVSPTRVVIDLSSLPHREEFARPLPAPSGFLVMSCTGTVEEIVGECQRVAPCVLVIGEESMEKLSSHGFPSSIGFGGSVRVLVLGSHQDSELIERWLCMGCVGYVSLDVTRQKLWKAIRAVASGEVWAGRKTLSQVMNKLIFKQCLQDLTVQERVILQLIARGLPNRAIANRLCVTHETIRWHIRSLYSKIGVHDRFCAMMYGSRLLETEKSPGPSGMSGVPRIPASGVVLQKQGTAKVSIAKLKGGTA